MGMFGPQWWIKVTHTPTGIEVIRDSRHFRSQHKAYESAKKYLRSKLWSLGLWIDPKDLIIEEIPIDPTEEDSIQCPEIERKED